ncbi:hypothetical protein [Mycobacterium talmoniae]|uniref:PE-PGRS family protein PE_PGRS30 n=1 Tax=Mycobacterium talmoniae TaxID=1858794 RepID=A0A1S1NMV7_9MYCO|nr:MULTISPECIES: hypothetical protein [Mycobacterium]OHV04097.1 hypothetical protein BKN37_11660 [Mycobacterium talmoniae]PQM44784.1 PE-PGRS family protein PE_PGRS30 [Mycobacterium talmoniae]TDH52687.1 hypothetical protein E2F47_13890 [Mycobacterium eburneum]
MHATLRPYLTAGVVLVGASTIAVTPAAAPLPAIQHRVVELTTGASALIDETHDIFGGALNTLTGAVGADAALLTVPSQVPLFTSWLDVFASAFSNAGELGKTVLADPAPILTQLVTNWLGYGQTYAGALGQAVENLVTQLTPGSVGGLWYNLDQAFELLGAGQFEDAVRAAYSGIIQTIIAPGFALLPTLQIPVEIAHNLYSAAQLIPQIAMGLGLGALGPLASGVYAFGASGQAVVDAIGDGNVLGALGAVANMPTAVVGGVLNGFEYGKGILSDPGGPIALLLQMRDTIADAIGAATGTQALTDGPLTALFSAPLEALSGAFGADGLSELGALLDPTQFLTSLGDLFDPAQFLGELGTVAPGVFADIPQMLLEAATAAIPF